MPRLNLPCIVAAIAVLLTMTGCATTAQPVAQSGAANKTKEYYTDENPPTGSRIGRRYSADGTPAASNVQTVDPAALQQTQFNPARGN